MTIVVIGHYPPGYKLAYYFDWRDAFLGLGPSHRVRVVNTFREWPSALAAADRLPGRLRLRDRLPLEWTLDTRLIRDVYSGETPCDVLVFAPSFYYFNGSGSRRALFDEAARVRHRFATVFFVENEYRLLADKVAYANALGANLLVSQLPGEVAAPFYGSRFRGRVLSLPAGLNPVVFRPERPLRERTIDVGTRSHVYPSGPLGDARNALLRRFAAGGPPLEGLRIDVSQDQRSRLTREGWAAFLNRCRATVASAAAARLWWEDEPRPPIEVGALSSRHFEAMGTGTALVLLEGRFDGVLEPDVHYLPVRHDLANLAEVAAALRDLGRLEKIARAAHELALDGHTYAHRVRQLLSWL